MNMKKLPLMNIPGQATLGSIQLWVPAMKAIGADLLRRFPNQALPSEEGEAIVEAMCQRAFLGLSQGPENDNFRQEVSYLMRVLVANAPSWVNFGCPSVSISGQRAAAMMATRLTGAYAKDLRFPWPMFFIRLPDVLPGEDGLFVAQDPESGAVHIMVLGKCPWTFARESISDIAALDPAAWEQHPIVKEVTDDDGHTDSLFRKALLVGRLVCGIAGEMTGYAREIAEGPRKRACSKKIQRVRGLPSEWNFQLCKPVRADVRSAVREFAVGKRGGSLSLQHCVVGHFKWQPHGPNNSLRKWIHVEPYWRGPNDAPIADRDHSID